MCSLTFPMGQYRAPIPTDRQYTTSHLWAQKAGTGYRFGFTAYAVRLLGDVYFLEWTVENGTRLAAREAIGEIESKKAESQLFAPSSGQLVRFNESLLHDPAIINQDTYRTWLFEMGSVDDTFLSPQAYVEHLRAVWQVTQKLIREGTCRFL